VTTGIHGAHVLAGLLLILYVMRKASAGGFSAKNYGTVENLNLYWSFVSSVWLVVFALFYLI
jgi:cytochrome c oxidase subunit I+III